VLHYHALLSPCLRPPCRLDPLQGFSEYFRFRRLLADLALKLDNP